MNLDFLRADTETTDRRQIFSRSCLGIDQHSKISTVRSQVIKQVALSVSGLHQLPFRCGVSHIFGLAGRLLGCIANFTAARRNNGRAAFIGVECDGAVCALYL
jgi:hypothetical protein